VSKVTTRQIRALAPYLEGDKPTHINTDRDTGEQTREWNLRCPLHDDHTRSASINVDKGLFWCAKCGGMPVTALIRRQDEWQHVSMNGNGRVPNLNGQPESKPIRVLSEGMIAGWHSALMANPSALQWLRETRGLRSDTVVENELGLHDGRLYTIPVRSSDREIWNVRYYNPRPGSEARKIWSETGYGSPNRLYPIRIFNEDPREVIIGEGEWDVLLALQFGYTAVTRTGAADVWLAEWGEWFKDRVVYLGHDCDEKGQKANRVVGRALQRIADVRIIEWPYAILPKHGKDMTDFLLEHDPAELRGLLEAARPFTKAKQVDELQTVTVLDTHDARRVGKPVRVIVTVKGRKEPGYTVPQKIQLACTQDAGQKCMICPLRAANGEALIEITPSDPMVLSMIEHPTSEMNRVIAESYGVPGGKCVKLQQEVQEHQAVEVLFARPALDHTDGSDTQPEAAQYKTIKITSVGRHDTPPNNTVAVVGALQPNPKTQNNEFLAHELEMLETSVDRFEITPETIAMMKRFQSTRPLKKLAEINKSLAEHVTRIHGRPEMHALMDLTFHSALSFKFAGELINRGWLESLIVGDTRTGKSLAAQRLVQHYMAGEIISCEAASFAGVIGGLQQLGGKDWAVTWGVVPINDRRIVVLDEISGLTHEEIAQMSDIRSSGQAKLIKIQQETTWARTRLLWLGNPRNATMANYTYGVDAIKPLIGNAEDIARFDLAMAVTLFDVAAEVINQPVAGGELRYTSEACHALLMWVWTRSADQVVWAAGSEEKVFDLANELGKLYIEDPPLVQAANIRIKIARTAVAIAGRLFSTDDSHESIVVHPAHVEAAAQFINLLYGMQAFGYRERSREALADRYEAEKSRGDVAKYLKGRPLLAKFLRTTGKFRRQDLEEIMSLSKEESNAIISSLYEWRMVRKVLGDIVVEPTLHAVLREQK
jgi:hypothetical protein